MNGSLGPPGDGSPQQEILRFYDEHRYGSGWSHLAALRAFLPELLSNRDLSGCHYFTSHAAFCLSRFPNYEQRESKPILSIYATSPELLELELTTFDQRLPVHRSFSERVVCPLNTGLTQFDQLYAKFLDAHE